jgi:hypothetical protein
MIAEKVRGDRVRVRVILSHADGKIQSYLNTIGCDLERNYIDTDVQIDVTLGKNQIAQLKRLGAGQIEYL